LIILGSVAMSFATSSDLGVESGIDAKTYYYGLSIVVFSGAGFAASECFAKILAHRIEPSELVMWRGIFLGFVFFVMVIVEDGLKAFSQVSYQDWVICALAALLGPVLARVLFMTSLRKIDLGKAYLICQNEPIVTALFAWNFEG